MFSGTCNFKHKPGPRCVADGSIWNASRPLLPLVIPRYSWLFLFTPVSDCWSEAWPLSSAGNTLKHMDVLKGSVWQIVIGEMLTCGKVLAPGARWGPAVVPLRSGVWGSAGRGGPVCVSSRKLPAEINVTLVSGSFKARRCSKTHFSNFQFLGWFAFDENFIWNQLHFQIKSKLFNFIELIQCFSKL